MVARGRAEVPHPRLAVAGQQAPARELVARPLADDGAGEIADVVLVEDEHGAEPGGRQRPARAAEAVGVQAPEIHALLEVDLHVAGRLQRTIPAVAGVHVVGRDGSGARLLLACHRWPPCRAAILYRGPRTRAQSLLGLLWAATAAAASTAATRIARSPASQKLLDVPGVLRSAGIELERDQIGRGRHRHGDALDRPRTARGRRPRPATPRVRRPHRSTATSRFRQPDRPRPGDRPRHRLECRRSLRRCSRAAHVGGARDSGIASEQIEVAGRAGDAVHRHRGRPDHRERDSRSRRTATTLASRLSRSAPGAQREGRRPCWRRRRRTRSASAALERWDRERA